MSEKIRIDKVSKEAGTWSNKYGEYQGYDLDLVKEDEEVEIGVGNNRKLKPDGSHFEPKVGEEVWGSIVPDGRGGQKLEVDANRMKDEPLGNGSPASSQPPSQPSSTSRGSGSGETNREVRNAEIRRQHSQEMALRYAERTKALENLSDAILSVDPRTTVPELFWELCDQFDQDAIGAGQKGPEPSLDVLNEFSDPGKDRQDFMELLYSKGVTSIYAADFLTDYYLTLDVKRQLRCGNALMGEEYITALDRLVGEAEGAAGTTAPPLAFDPMGKPSHGDDIPF